MLMWRIPYGKGLFPSRTHVEHVGYTSIANKPVEQKHNPKLENDIRHEAKRTCLISTPASPNPTLTSPNPRQERREERARGGVGHTPLPVSASQYSFNLQDMS